MLDAFKQLIGHELSDSPSAMARWLRGVLRGAEEGHLTVEYIVRPEMTNPVGTLHGGVIATMLDDVMGMTVMSLGRSHFFASINLHVDYLAAARPGDRLIAQGRIIRAGKNVVNAEGILSDSHGKLIARASANLGRVEAMPLGHHEPRN